MKAELVGDRLSSGESNTIFELHLRRWFREQDIHDAVGAIIIALQPEGFTLSHIGPRVISGAELIAWIKELAENIPED